MQHPEFRLYVLVIGVVAALGAAPLSAQAPAAQAPAKCDAIGDVQFICGQNGPEDLVVVPGGQWVVASSYGGSGGVMLIRVSDRMSSVGYPGAAPKERLDAKTYNTCPGPPDAAFKAKFLTHGLYLQAGTNSVHKLFVVVHGGREAVEVFELDARPQTPTLTWIGCAVAPDPIGLNSVRALPDGGFIASNFLPRGTNMGTIQKGEKNGELWEWHTASGWQKVPASEASGANGLEMSEDGRTLYVAAWGSQSFFRLSRGPANPVGARWLDPRCGSGWYRAGVYDPNREDRSEDAEGAGGPEQTGCRPVQRRHGRGRNRESVLGGIVPRRPYRAV
jgi:hypothetical protein